MRPPLSTAGGRLRGAMTSTTQRGPQGSETDEEIVEKPREAPKDRRCLRCSGAFVSAWSGERICPRCKKSPTWRRGVPAPPTKTPGRR